MDLSNLHPSPERKRELEKLLDQAHKNYLDGLENLVDAAGEDMETVLAREPLNAQELVEQYSRDASQLANDYYDTQRELWMEYGGVQFPDFDHTGLIDPDRVLWQQQGGFADTDFNGLTYTQTKSGRNRAGKTIRDLWPSFSDLDDAQQFIADMIGTSARLTTQRNIRIDPSKPRWARVPRGAKTCAFCTMLASRGFAYLSEDTAGRQMQYHHDCDCQIVPSWGEHSLEGYDPDEYLRMYDAANEATDGNDYREILKTMRRQNPDSLKDGVKATTGYVEKQPLKPFEGEAYDALGEWVGASYSAMRSTQKGDVLWANGNQALIDEYTEKVRILEESVQGNSTNKVTYRGVSMWSKDWKDELNAYPGEELNEHALSSWTTSPLTAVTKFTGNGTANPVVLVNRKGGANMLSCDIGVGEELGELEYLSSGSNRYKVLSVKDNVSAADLSAEFADELKSEMITIIEVEQFS